MKYIDNYEDTLFGSLVEAIGIISNKSKSSRWRLFFNLYNWNGPIYNCQTISEVAEYIWSIYGDDRYRKDRANLFLLTDINNVRSPIVGVLKDGEFVQYTNNPNLITLYKEGRDYIEAENLYNEEGELIT